MGYIANSLNLYYDCCNKSVALGTAVVVRLWFANPLVHEMFQRFHREFVCVCVDIFPRKIRTETIHSVLFPCLRRMLLPVL